MNEAATLLHNVTPEQEQAVIDIADKNDRRFRIDWKISIPSITAAAVVMYGYVWAASGKSSALEEVERTTAAHTEQLKRLDETTVATNLEVAGIKGDIKEILAILRQQLDRPAAPSRPFP